MPTTKAHRAPTPTWHVAAAFAVVYVVWGSTYLGIRYGIATIPPLLMAGTRHLTAGALLYTWCRLRGAPRPTAREWREAALIGALLLVLGNGGVTWAEQRLPSAVTALLVATEPLWLVGFAWAARGGMRPSIAQFIGVALGLVGVTLLVWPNHHLSGQAADPISALVVLGAAFAWAGGSLYASRAPVPRSRPLMISMQMLTGGAFLVLSGLATGEGAKLHLAQITTTSVLALLYLVIFGSLIGFSAYSWLLDKAPPARVSTYAYVNPMIAVLLGWVIAHEPLGARAVAAMVLIVAAVVLLTIQPGKSAPQPSTASSDVRRPALAARVMREKEPA